MKKILTEAATVGDATARALTYRMRDKEAYYYEGSAWRTAFLGGYSFERNGIKLIDSSSQYYFYATGVTPAMEAKMVGSGSQYALAFVDAKGQPLDGSRTYRLHVPANVPINNFWSVIAYDNQARSFCRPTRHGRRSRARTRTSRPMPTAQWTCISLPSGQRTPRTSSRPFLARAGMRSSGFTVRSNRGSTRRGGSARSS